MALIFKLYDIHRRKMAFALEVAISEAEFQFEIRGWPEVTERKAYFGSDGYAYVVVHDRENYVTTIKVDSIWSTTVISRAPQEEE